MSILPLLDQLVENEENSSEADLSSAFNRSNKIKCLFLRYKNHISSFRANTKFLWGNDASAEYVVDILTQDGAHKNVEFLSVPSGFDHSLLRHTDILVYSSNTYSTQYILELIDKLSPRVLIHLSDYIGDREEYAEAFSQVSLVYREYKHPHYHHGTPARIDYIPIGYHSWGKTYVRGRPRPVRDRSYKWCFSGDMKKRREDETNALRSIAPHFCERTEPFELTDVYQNSVFAYCPEGSRVIECSRIYEAMYNGCVPIIYSTDREGLEQLRTMFGTPMPCYFTGEFERVFDIINNTDRADIEQVQQRCRGWLDTIARRIRTNIVDACQQSD